MLFKTAAIELEIDLLEMLYLQTKEVGLCITHEPGPAVLPRIQHHRDGFTFEGFRMRIEFVRSGPRRRPGRDR